MNTNESKAVYELLSMALDHVIELDTYITHILDQQITDIVYSWAMDGTPQLLENMAKERVAMENRIEAVRRLVETASYELAGLTYSERLVDSLTTVWLDEYKETFVQKHDVPEYNIDTLKRFTYKEVEKSVKVQRLPAFPRYAMHFYIENVDYEYIARLLLDESIRERNNP